MDWTLEDIMMDSSMFFCATLTGRRIDHTPFMQARVEMSDTGAEADPGCSWKCHSRSGAGVGNESRV